MRFFGWFLLAIFGGLIVYIVTKKPSASGVPANATVKPGAKVSPTINNTTGTAATAAAAATGAASFINAIDKLFGGSGGNASNGSNGSTVASDCWGCDSGLINSPSSIVADGSNVLSDSSGIVGALPGVTDSIPGMPIASINDSFGASLPPVFVPPDVNVPTIDTSIAPDDVSIYV